MSDTNPPLSLGAINDDEEDLLRKYLSPALKGPGWDALIAALATGDSYRNVTAQSAFDQLFKSTASGVFLDRRAADDGLARPANIGISDDVFRKLAIQTTARKLVIEVILESLEAYYGSETTRAFSTSSIAEPYALVDGDSLLVQTDNGKIITVSFSADDFALIGAALAIEVSTVITRELRIVGSTAYAVPFKDPEQGTTFVRIFSGALGLTGSVRILGGSSQNALLFQTQVHPTGGDGPQATTQFTITSGTGLNGVSAGLVRFTFAGGTDPDLAKVRQGDYVNIYGGVFASNFRATYSVANTSPTYFEITDSKLTWPGSVTLASATDVRFYRPTPSTIQSTGRMATATQGDPSRLDVILPTTTQAVSRNKTSAAYLHAAVAINISSASRDATGLTTVNTAIAHGLATGDLVFIDGLFPTPTGVSGLGWQTADSGSNSLPYEDSAAIKLSDGTILQSGGVDTAGPTSHADVRIFTPGTNVWATKTSMSNVRRGHTLTLLNSGKILAIGGTTSTKVCELYDIPTDTWTDTGANSGTHEYHTATLMNDGKVLVNGGGNGSELYDPSTGLWTDLTNQPATNRSRHTADKLLDGRVLIAGGNPGGATAEVFNYVTGMWTSTGNMTATRYDHRARRLAVGTSGNVFIVGGYTGSVYLSSTEMFNPSTMTFTAAASMATPRARSSITVRADGKVLAAGGTTTGGTFTNTADLYNPIDNTWTPVTGTFTTARTSPVGIDLTDGRVIVVGGEGARAVALKYTGPAVNAGQLNDLFRVTVTGSSVFTFLTPNTAIATTCGAVGTVTPYTTPTNAAQGPFIYDDQGGAAVTGIATTITSEIVNGSSYTVITVADASTFPDDEGYLVFGFGTDLSLSPVHYLGRVSGTTLLLDPTFEFPQTLPVGTSVTLLEERGAFVPDHPEQVGTFYLTAAAAGRVAASSTIDNLVAAGVEVVKTVIYPGDVGLGNEGQPVSGVAKIADKVEIWGGDDVDEEIALAREDE